MINRIPEKVAIADIYNAFSDRSALLILYARTGVGKTLLTDTIFTDLIGCHYIRLRVNQQQGEETKGFYLSSLAKALNDYAYKTDGFVTIEEFIDAIYNINKNGESVINDLLDVAFILAKGKDLREKLTESKAVKDNLIKTVLESDNEIAISFLLEYIIHISEEQKIILCVENIQNANQRLITFVNELLKKTKNLFLIGEYTISNTEFEVTALFKQFPYECTSVYELKKLDKVELLGGLPQIVERDSIDYVHQIIESSYDDSSGNLANLQFLIRKNAHELNLSHEGNLAKIKYDNALHSIYSKLTNSQRICLWYIVSHLGRVNTHSLEKLCNITRSCSFHDSVDVLKNSGMITIEDERLTLVHDSMIEILAQEDDSRKFQIICNHDWLNYYRDISIRTDFVGLKTLSKEDLLTLQLTFILNIGGSANVDWMNRILSEISQTISGSFSYALISKVVDIFYQVVVTSENQKLIYKTFEWIAIILSKLGQWEQLAKIISSYKVTQVSDLLFLLQATARVATCDSTIKKELESITDRNNTFLYIGAQLLLIRYYRTFSQIKKARHIWKQLRIIDDVGPYQYTINDQINLCSLNFKKRQQFLRISKDGYFHNGDLYQYCTTLMNINANSYYLYFSKLLSKRKFLKIANENLNKVKELLAETHYPLHVYLNQKTIVQFVDGKVPAEMMLKNFETAYSNCGISGNKLLIGANVVAVGLKYNKVQEVADYVQELMQISRKYSELKSEFAKYPLVNCYNYYLKTGNVEGRKSVLRLFRENSSLNDVTDYVMAIPLLNKLSLRLVKYYPCNIYGWDIDFQSMRSKFAGI